MAEREFNLIRYIISKEEQEIFGDLNLDGKRQFIEDFWKRRDPTPETLINEFRQEHVRRFEEANRLFTQAKREGWKTDLGRVFIVYGKPDEVERHANQIDLRPYEVWYYFNIEGGVQFIFGDLDGFGNYTLIHSTARNEVNDPDYFRWLQNTTPR
jgi:GWxTD domain-containing protein